MKKMQAWCARFLAAWLLAGLLAPCACLAEGEATDMPEETPVSVETLLPSDTPQADASTPAPESTPDATATPAPEATKEVLPELSLADEGWEAQAGEAVTLALPLEYALDGVRVSSSEFLWQTEGGASLIELSYADSLSGRYAGAFTGELAAVLQEAEVRLVWDETSGSLFSLRGDLSAWPVNGAFLSPYALFEGLTIRQDVTPGTYTLHFEIYYTDRAGHTNRGGEAVRQRVKLEVLGAQESTPSPQPSPEITDEPTQEPGDEPSDWVDPSEGRLMLGEVQGTPEFSARREGGTLQVPVSFAVDTLRVYSNRDEAGNYAPYAAGAEYAQDILEYLDYLSLEITPEMAADLSCPLEMGEQGVAKVIVDGGVNYGYAVFENVRVKSTASNGVQPVTLLATYRLQGETELQQTEISLNVNVTGVSSGGGGGGSGAYASPTALPQARLLVERIATDPQNVTAGDRFDLVFTIRNTSQTQYVQNIRATINVQDDVLLPESGSNTVYIDRIDANSTYELRYAVQSSLSVPETALKVDIQFEYEDQTVTSQGASQTLNVQVAQLQRIKVDDPITDAASPTEGDSYDISLQVINEGRTTLYNVTVTARTDNENLALPASYYLGNMESGSSKKAELSVTPLVEGQYELNLEVSYEDGMGTPYSLVKPVSFWCDAEQSYDELSWSTYESNEADDWENEDSRVMEILSLMPWWIFAAAAALVSLLVISIGVSAHSRHVKALEDDEMD